MGIPMMALADAPASYNWATAPGGALNASTVDFDAWMEAMSEYVYDNDVPYSFMDPNGEPDGINERGYAVDWPPPWDRGDPDPADLWPATVVPNDGNGNGMPDILEFAVIKEICNNESTYPTLHAEVHESFKKNFAYFGANLGLAGNMVPALKYILAAYAMLGDGSYQRFRYPEGPCPTACTEYGFGWEGSWGVAAEMIYAMNDVFANGWRPAGTASCATCNSAPNDTQCDRLESLLSACGDVDGDGVTNIGEFYGQGGVAGVYDATVRANYVAAVLDPLVTADGGDPDEVCVEGPPGPGLTWNLNLWWNPANHFVYVLGPVAPWPVNESFAETYTLGERKEAVPGHLATIRSAEENAWITTNVRSKAGGDMWIGANDIADEGAWVWVENDVQFWEGTASGSVVGGNYVNWNGGEPNASGDGGQMYEGGTWDDTPFDRGKPGCLEFTNGGAGYDDGNGNGYPDFWETYVEAPGGPTAAFHADVTSGMQPLTVNFTDDSTAPEGETIASWSWDFGDESPLSIEQNPTHVYADFGTFTVALTVETDIGGTNTKTETAYITVTERMYRASIDAAGGAWLEEGDLLSLTAVVTGGTPPIEYRWQKNGEDIVPPATTATYEKVAAVGDSGAYTCVVNDDSKAETVAGPYTVTVFAAGSLPVAGIVGLALLAGAAILGARSAFRKK
jgi:PKD repeat protein